MHLPVLYNEALELLITNREGVYVDCTVGGGGHLNGILEKTGPGAAVVGIDRDAGVLEQTARSFANEPRLRLVPGDFRHLEEILAELGLNQVDGILLDLGVSSFQLDDEQRGFSYHQNAALDMRMDRGQEQTAWHLVNEAPAEELEEIIRRYGEERHARLIVRGIVKARPVNTTVELAEVIKRSIPGAYQTGKHPARRTFQALRIAVNDELGALLEVLPQAMDLLRIGGRLVIITFHSLEDRMVKEFFAREARDCLCPPRQPVCTCGHTASLRVLTKKPLAADRAEVERNRRARSAKLRAVEKSKF